MVIKDLSSIVIIQSLAAQLNQIQQSREEARIKLIRYYEHNGTEQYVKDYFKGTSLSQIPVFTQAFVRRAVDQRSLVYKKSPQVMADEKYLEMTKNLNSERRTLEKLTFLEGTMAFLSKKHRDWDIGNQILDYDHIPVFTPFFLPGDKVPMGISYPLYHYDNARINKPINVVWTADHEGQPGEHYMIIENKIVFPKNSKGEEGDGLNPYGVLPVSFAHRYPNIAGEFWVEGATDLMKANLQIDIAMTELALAYRFDAVGIKWIKGVDEVQEVESGTDRFILIPEGADIGRLGSALLTQLIDTIKFMAESSLQNNHLMVKWADTGQAKSGEALRMENIENIEQREAAIDDTWRRWESDRFEIDRKILEVNDIKVSEEYSVNFTEPTPPMSQSEEREQWTWDLDRGYKTDKEYIKFKNPDISDDELKKKLDHIEEMNASPEPAGTLLGALEEPVA